jgi:mitochondrial transcription factor 1
MFWVIVAAGRSAQRRSPKNLLSVRHFHVSITTRQQNPTATSQTKIPVRTPKPSYGVILSDSPPPLSTFSDLQDAIELKTQNKTAQSFGHNDGAGEIAPPITPVQPISSKPTEINHYGPETESAKPVKRGRGRPAKLKDPAKKRNPRSKPGLELEDPPKPRQKPEPKPKPKPEVDGPLKSKGRPRRTPKILEDNSHEGNVITLFEKRNKAKHETFSSGNIRADCLPYLQWARGYGQGRSIGDNRRINIVSESLCGKTPLATLTSSKCD